MLAGAAAERLIAKGVAPREGVSFLRSHGELDPHHVAELVQVVERIDDPVEIELIALSARMTARLYPLFFLPLRGAARVPMEAKSTRRQRRCGRKPTERWLPASLRRTRYCR